MEFMNPDNKQMDLYWSLFVHRDDAFAQYELNRKTNKQGWHTACEYDHQRSRHLIKLSPNLLRLHFAGIERLGVYSTLPVENSCRWIAADVDENSGAFEQCLKLKHELAKYEIPCFIERSNSGKGYHAFVFFKEPIQASKARRMMYGALHEADIPVSGKFEKGNDNSRAIDRLFPCQDTVPANGFGNQISLPFYGKAVQQGNTLFIDDNEEVIPDQWNFLQEVYDNHRVAKDEPRIEVLASLSKLAEPKNIFDQNDNDYFLSLATLDGQFERSHGCQAIKQSISNPNQFGNFAWVGVLSNIAVFGSKGRDLAHEVSKGYDMTAVKNDPKAVYTEEETDRVFFSKVNHIQKNGPPMTCKRLANEGWECPRLEDGTCKAGFPVKFEAPPSFTVYSPDRPITVPERVELSRLEQQGLYEKFRSILPWGNKVSDYRIAQHLLGISPLNVFTYNPKGDSVTSVFQTFTQDEDSERFQEQLEKVKIPFARRVSDFWLIGQTVRLRSDMVKFMKYLFDQSGILPTTEISIEIVNKLVNVMESVAPYLGRLYEFVLYLEGRE